MPGQAKVNRCAKKMFERIYKVIYTWYGIKDLTQIATAAKIRKIK